MTSGRGALHDPILERIAASDPDEFERCVMALAQLGSPAALGLANYDALPDVAMNALAEDASPDVRAAVARHPKCPPLILERLADDTDSNVRRSVAANDSSPSDLLLLLASDEDEWVRFEVGRNPSATDAARAAFVRASTPEMITNARESRPFMFAEEDPALTESELRSLTQAALARANDYEVRSHLAANPSLPKDLVPELVSAALHRWEWRSLWGRGLVTKYRHGLVWPSTHAYLVPAAPQWLLNTLGRYGHPAALIHVGTDAQPPVVDAWLAVRDLINSELLVRALWRELALVGAVALVYWNDTVDGDHFFPQADGVTLMEGNTAAEYLIGGYSAAREWVQTEDTLEKHSVLRRAAGLFDDWFVTQADEFDSDSLGLFALAGAAWAEEMGSVPITWTEAGENAVEDQLWTFIAGFADSEDYDTKVTVVESQLPGIGYAETSDAQKTWLTELLRQARSNSMMSTWGLSDHLLMCIALHPATPQSIRDQLLMDSSERVRQAALLATGRQ